MFSLGAADLPEGGRRRRRPPAAPEVPGRRRVEAGVGHRQHHIVVGGAAVVAADVGPVQDVRGVLGGGPSQHGIASAHHIVIDGMGWTTRAGATPPSAEEGPAAEEEGPAGSRCRQRSVEAFIGRVVVAIVGFVIAMLVVAGEEGLGRSSCGGGGTPTPASALHHPSPVQRLAPGDLAGLPAGQSEEDGAFLL